MKKDKKRYVISIFFIFLLMFIEGCGELQEPIISIYAQVSKIDDQEMANIGAKELTNSTKGDFRKFTFDLSIIHLENVVSQTINFPENWAKLIDSNGKDRYWYGSDSNQENENDVYYTNEFIFYSKGLSKEEIKKAYQSAIINISWLTKEGKWRTREFVIGDYMIFK
ncbi:hypothetical protein J6TS2_21790 [Heyndrickxia sporothermodurans]|nr:hypothetical protein J6TS2_21790 [Heyndrickxia sporothermodurans]